MRLILEVISGPFQGKKIEAKVGETVSIGRTPKAKVAMDDSFLSGEHFAIECNLNGCRVRDLNSRNGTQLNGQMITDASLTDGDQVHAGKTDFKVRIEDNVSTVRITAADQAVMSSEVGTSEARPAARRGQSNKPPPVAAPEPLAAPVISADPPTRPEVPVYRDDVKARERVETGHPPQAAPRVSNERVVPSTTELKQESPQPSPPPSLPSRPQGVPQNALESYEAETPGGRLIQILSSQPGSLMALVDAVHNKQLLELIRSEKKEFHSLYRSEQNAAIAPYLVALPPRSDLLKQMVQKGWGQEWGVYLTSTVSLLQLREFFRTSLMVTMPDGMELFSRFYDPKFFRAFLETCSAAEAERFFGPITSYFMEDERPEILLQFSRSRNGAEKKGHLLSVLS